MGGRNGYIRREVVSGDIYRQIPVGEVDPNSVSAEFENGVLKVRLPAPSRPEPVKIAISSESGGTTLEKGNRKQLAAKPASFRQNEDMRRITALVSIVAVPTLIAGIYGMNFKYMPELDYWFAYPAAIGFMAVVCFGLWFYFRRAGWL